MPCSYQAYLCRLPFIRKDLMSPASIKAKGPLFLLLGFISAILRVLEHLTLRVAALLLLAVWSLRRFYCFAFYVLQRCGTPRMVPPASLSGSPLVAQHARQILKKQNMAWSFP